MYVYLIRIDEAQVARPTSIQTRIVADLLGEPRVLVAGLEQRAPTVNRMYIYVDRICS